MSAARLHLVDGTFELYRAHFSPRPGDLATKATVGLVASLRALLRDPAERVTHLAVAFDNPIRSFRNDLYAGYKSDEGVPPELRAQFDVAEEAARALGVAVWSMARWEADDALASAAARWAGAFGEIRILSPDKDLGQCLTRPGVTLVDRIRRRALDRAGFLSARGFDPVHVPDWLALTGDAADGFPGLPGFGEKTATALVGAFGPLERIPDDPARWPAVRGAAKLATTLAGRRAEAALYQRLATLALDVPLPDDPEATRVRAPDEAALARLLPA